MLLMSGMKCRGGRGNAVMRLEVCRQRPEWWLRRLLEPNAYEAEVCGLPPHIDGPGASASINTPVHVSR